MMKTDFEREAASVRQWLETSTRAVVFTGAGISTESGISDFRSKGGLWQRFQPVTFQEFLADDDGRRDYWVYKKEVYEQIRAAKPNPGHLAIAKLEAAGKLLGVVTQNIDRLHQKAGSQKVLELHGNALEVICLDCKQIFDSESVYLRLVGGEEIPRCTSCGGWLKPNTISFGQELDPEVLRAAFDWARHCDLMLAVGSTLVVEPAASVPRIAKESGARLVIVNRDPTPLDFVADLVIRAPIGAFLSEVVE